MYKKWNKPKPEVRNAKQIGVFKEMIITEIKVNSLFSIHNSVGVKLFAHLKLQFSPLNKHKFRHDFKDTIILMCSYNTDIESNKKLSPALPFLFFSKIRTIR